MLYGPAVALWTIEDSVSSSTVLRNNAKHPMMWEEIGEFIIRLRSWPWSMKRVSLNFSLLIVWVSTMTECIYKSPMTQTGRGGTSCPVLPSLLITIGTWQRDQYCTSVYSPEKSDRKSVV